MTTIERVYIDLQTLSKDMESLASDWNGKDDWFMSGGDKYHEEDADLAGEVSTKCTELLALLEEVTESNIA